MNVLLLAVAILLSFDFVKYRTGRTFEAFLETQNLWFRWMVFIGLFLMILIFGVYGPAFDAQAFIYFQF